MGGPTPILLETPNYSTILLLATRLTKYPFDWPVICWQLICWYVKLNPYPHSYGLSYPIISVYRTYIPWYNMICHYIPLFCIPLNPIIIISPFYNHIYIYTYIIKYVYIYICIYIIKYVFIYIYIYIIKYVYIYIYIYIYIIKYVYIYTYIYN